jgi:hypothetical protein
VITKKVSKKKKARKKETVRLKHEIVYDVPAPLDQSIPGINVKDRSRTRLEAGLVYASCLTGDMSVALLSKDPRFSDLKLATLERWAKEDDWVGKRKAMFAAVRASLEIRLGSKLTESVYREVQHCTEIGQLCMEHLMLTGKDGKLALKPRSWEGVARVKLEVDRRMDELRRMFGKELVQTYDPMPSRGPGLIPAKTEPFAPDYNKEELDIAVKAILKNRRDDLRGREETRKAVEPKPPQKLKVVGTEAE